MTNEEIELVELAALAAGYTTSISRAYAGAQVDIIAYGVDDYTYGIEWNPLVNDGDALQLATTLKLSISFEQRNQHEWTHIVWVNPYFEPLVGDIYAATRRAIVRAAAHLGQQIRDSKEVTNVNQV